MATNSNSLAEFLRRHGYDETTIQMKVRDAERNEAKQKAERQRVRDEQNAWINFGEGGQRQSYNPLTEAYSLKSEAGDIFSRWKDSEGRAHTKVYGSDILGVVRDPTKGRRYGDAFLAYDQIDPRAVAQMNEKDYAGLEDQLKSYSDQLNQWYEERAKWVENEFSPDGGWRGKVNQYMPAVMSGVATIANPMAGLTMGIMQQNEQERKELQNSSFGGQYASYFAPEHMSEELRNIHGFLSDQKGVNSWATQKAYLNALERLGGSQDDFYAGLKGQAEQLKAQQKYISPEQNSKYLDHVLGISSDPRWQVQKLLELKNQGYNVDDRLSSISSNSIEALKKSVEGQNFWKKDQYGRYLANSGGKSVTWDQSEYDAYNYIKGLKAPSSPVAQQTEGDPTTQAYNQMSNNHQATPQWAQDQLNKQGNKVQAMQLGYRTNINGVEYVRTDKGLERLDTVQNVPVGQTPSTSDYAKQMVTPTGSVTPEEPKQENITPWSKDFESQLLNQVGSFLGNFGQQKPNYNFSLGYGQKPASAQRNSGLINSTPTSIYSGQTMAPSQSSTGKAGQSNQQTSMWR